MSNDKRVTVSKQGRTYYLYMPGPTTPFASYTSAGEACSMAWTAARHVLRNDSINWAGSVRAVGFKLDNVKRA